MVSALSCEMFWMWGLAAAGPRPTIANDPTTTLSSKAFLITASVGIAALLVRGRADEVRNRAATEHRKLRGAESSRGQPIGYWPGQAMSAQELMGSSGQLRLHPAREAERRRGAEKLRRDEGGHPRGRDPGERVGHGARHRSANARLRTGLKRAPDTGAKMRIRTARIAPVGKVCRGARSPHYRPRAAAP